MVVARGGGVISATAKTEKIFRKICLGKKKNRGGA